MEYNVEVFIEGLNQQQNDELYTLLRKFSGEGAFVYGSRDKITKEPKVTIKNDSEKQDNKQ